MGMCVDTSETAEPTSSARTAHKRLTGTTKVTYVPVAIAAAAPLLEANCCAALLQGQAGSERQLLDGLRQSISFLFSGSRRTQISLTDCSSLRDGTSEDSASRCDSRSWHRGRERTFLTQRRGKCSRYEVRTKVTVSSRDFCGPRNY